VKWLIEHIGDKEPEGFGRNSFDRRCSNLGLAPDSLELAELMSEHLMPNDVFSILKKHEEIKACVKSHRSFLEQAKKEVMAEMEFNWKIIHAIQETVSERNILYSILREIEDFCSASQVDSEEKTAVLDILLKVPEDFAQVSDKELANGSIRSPRNEQKHQTHQNTLRSR